MKIILIGTAEQRSAWTSQGVKEGTVVLTATDIRKVKDQADACIDLAYTNAHDELLQTLRMPLVLNAVTQTLAQLPSNSIRIAGWNGFLDKPVIEAAGPAALQPFMEALFAQFNKTITWVPDKPGLIAPRVISKIIYEARLAEQEGVSSRAEIDTAMKLGTNYPVGPFEWETRIGAAQVDELLEQLVL